MNDIDKLPILLQKAWCAETSASPENWTILNPSLGQCAVTAAIIHERTGLDVVRGWAIVNGEKISHYWNRDLDLTAGQFPENTLFEEREGPQGPEAYTYLLSNSETAERATLLRARIALLEAGHTQGDL